MKEKKKVDSNTKRTRFEAPTTDEVRAYCSERGNNVDAQRFVDYYSANGWMVGKNHMKDWKAAVRTWEKNNASQPRQVQVTKVVPAAQYEQR